MLEMSFIWSKRRYQLSHMCQTRTFFTQKSTKMNLFVFIHSFIHAKCEMLLHVYSGLRNCIKFLFFLQSYRSQLIEFNRNMLKCTYAEAPLPIYHLALSTQCPKILEWWNHYRHTSLVDSVKCWLKVLTNQFYGMTCQYFARPSKTHAHTHPQTQTQTQTLTLTHSECKHSAKLYSYWKLITEYVRCLLMEQLKIALNTLAVIMCCFYGFLNKHIATKTTS